VLIGTQSHHGTPAPTSVKASNKAHCVPKWLSVVSNLSSSEWAPLPAPPPSIVTEGIPKLIGIFESVLEAAAGASKPSTSAAAKAA